MSEKVRLIEGNPPLFIQFQDYLLNVSDIRWVKLDIWTRDADNIEYGAKKYGDLRPHGGGTTYGDLIIHYGNGDKEVIKDHNLTGIVGDDISELQHDYDEFCETLKSLNKHKTQGSIGSINYEGRPIPAGDFRPPTDAVSKAPVPDCSVFGPDGIE